MQRFTESQGFTLSDAVVFTDRDATGVGLAELIQEIRRVGVTAVVMPGVLHLTATQLDALRAYVDVLTVHPRNRWPRRESSIPVRDSAGPIFRAGTLDDPPISASEAQRVADQVHARVVARFSQDYNPDTYGAMSAQQGGTP